MPRDEFNSVESVPSEWEPGAVEAEIKAATIAFDE